MMTIMQRQTDYIRRVRDFRTGIFDRIRSKDSRSVWLTFSLADVKQVVIINAGPRSGSSLLFSILRKFPGFYSPSGENVPFYRLHGFLSDTFPSDEIPPEFIRQGRYSRGLSRDFLSDFSIEISPDDIFNSERLFEQYVDDLCLRFVLQWPQVDFQYTSLQKDIRKAFEIYRKRHIGFNREKFYLDLLEVLCNKYKVINPYYYDLPGGMIKKRFPKIGIPGGPPNEVIMIEEPPFILLSPRKKVGTVDLRNRTLLLKSSTDSYRLRFIPMIFPNADIKIIYLVRNPASSMNGLFDGWLYRGFFSHNLLVYFTRKASATSPAELKITGYSDCYPWGKWWWKYDLPPGWQNHVQDRLEEICAFQWQASNRAIINYLKEEKKVYCLVRYEQIVRNLETRTREIKKILDFLGLDAGTSGCLKLDQLPVVQASQPPEPCRWKKRKEMIWRLLNHPQVAEISNELGYDKKKSEEWL